jgi:hypothetical protein
VVSKVGWARLQEPIYRAYLGTTEIPLSAEQKARAEQVRTLHAAMYHNSDEKLIAALELCTITGTSLAARDVKNAQRLFGPCLACKAGKTKRPGYTSSDNEPAEGVGDVVHAHIYALSKASIGNVNYLLLSVDEFSGYLNVIPIKQKSQKKLEEAFLSLEAVYKRNLLTIRNIQTETYGLVMAC